MTAVEWILLGMLLAVGWIAQTYKMQRDDLAAFIVYSGMLNEPEESDESNTSD